MPKHIRHSCRPRDLFSTHFINNNNNNNNALAVDTRLENIHGQSQKRKPYGAHMFIVHTMLHFSARLGCWTFDHHRGDVCLAPSAADRRRVLLLGDLWWCSGSCATNVLHVVLHNDNVMAIKDSYAPGPTHLSVLINKIESKAKRCTTPNGDRTDISMSLQNACHCHH